MSARQACAMHCEQWDPDEDAKSEENQNALVSIINDLVKTPDLSVPVLRSPTHVRIVVPADAANWHEGIRSVTKILKS